MTSAAIVQKLWNYCNVLRDDGMSYGDYPSTSLRAGSEQLTYLLFLKMADERTKPPYNQPSAVPAKYNWPTLLKKDGDDLFDHYRHMLESLGKDFSPSPLNSSPVEGEELWRKTLSLEKGLLGLIFNKSRNKFQDPSKLRRQMFTNMQTCILPQS
jgi:type I restriction enzyme M protein